jgi:hypothetical protein
LIDALAALLHEGTNGKFLGTGGKRMEEGEGKKGGGRYGKR